MTFGQKKVQDLRQRAMERARSSGSAFVVATYDRGDERVVGIWPLDEVDSDEWCAFDAMVVCVCHPNGEEE